MLSDQVPLGQFAVQTRLSRLIAYRAGTAGQGLTQYLVEKSAYVSLGRGGHIATQDLVDKSAKVLLLRGHILTHLNVESSLKV